MSDRFSPGCVILRIESLGGHVFKCTVTKCRCISLEDNSGKIAAGTECTKIDLSHSCRNYNLAQRCTFIECPAADGGQTGSQCNFLQAGTAIESVRLNGCNTLRDCDFGQGRASAECVGCDRSQILGQRNTAKAGTTHESAPFNCSDAGRDFHDAKFGTISECARNNTCDTVFNFNKLNLILVKIQPGCFRHSAATGDSQQGTICRSYGKSPCCIRAAVVIDGTTDSTGAVLEIVFGCRNSRLGYHTAVGAGAFPQTFHSTSGICDAGFHKVMLANRTVAGFFLTAGNANLVFYS